MPKAQSSPCDWIACDLPWAPEEPGKVRLLPALPGRGLESVLIVLTLLWEQDFCLESKCSSCRNVQCIPFSPLSPPLVNRAGVKVPLGHKLHVSCPLPIVGVRALGDM